VLTCAAARLSAARAHARRFAHLYFVYIHPFEHCNGRIGRALAEKSLAQNPGEPSLIVLAYTRTIAPPWSAITRASRSTAG